MCVCDTNSAFENDEKSDEQTRQGGKAKKGEEEESGRFDQSQTVKCEVKEK